MKKKYYKPEMQVYDMKPTSILCGSNDPANAKSNPDPDELSGSADKYYYLD